MKNKLYKIIVGQAVLDQNSIRMFWSTTQEMRGY